jgi:hypothetical protein
LSEDEIREAGFEIFKKGLVRRLSPTHYVAKAPTAEAWQLIELKQGKWTCDCSADQECGHLYAAQLQRSTSRFETEQVDETRLKCRYCGSPDIARCGFRYNARGIARRYVCHDCQRKFSIPHVQSAISTKPVELVWLFNEIGMLTSKLNDLLLQLNDMIERASVNGLPAGAYKRLKSPKLDIDTQLVQVKPRE